MHFDFVVIERSIPVCVFLELKEGAKSLFTYRINQKYCCKTAEYSVGITVKQIITLYIPCRVLIDLGSGHNLVTWFILIVIWLKLNYRWTYSMNNINYRKQSWIYDYIITLHCTFGSYIPKIGTYTSLSCIKSGSVFKPSSTLFGINVDPIPISELIYGLMCKKLIIHRLGWAGYTTHICVGIYLIKGRYIFGVNGQRLSSIFFIFLADQLPPLF